MPPSVAASVLEDNVAFLRHLNLFDTNFASFSRDLCASFASTMFVEVPPSAGTLNCCMRHGCSVPTCGLSSEQVAFASVLLEYGLKVVARAADTLAFGKFCDAVAPVLLVRPEMARHVFSMARTHDALFKDVLLRNPVPAVRAAFAGLLVKLVAFLAPIESAGYMTVAPEEVPGHWPCMCRSRHVVMLSVVFAD
jgi:hypothetical protein